MSSPLKKIQELVYKGMVLNDHGKWVPLAEKIRKEKAFLRHLEQGEILVDGVWSTFADIHASEPALDETQDVGHAAAAHRPPVQPPLPEVTPIVKPATPPGEIPEETVSFSTDTLRDFSMAPRSAVQPLSEEDDFAPETRIFKIERTGKAPPPPPAPQSPSQPSAADRTKLSETAVDMTVSGETHAYIIPDKPSPSEILQKRVTPETEYLETALYNTRTLKKPESAPIASGKTTGTARTGLQQPRAMFASEEDDHLLKKGSPPFWLFMLLGIGGIVVLAAVWLFL